MAPYFNKDGHYRLKKDILMIQPITFYRQNKN